MLEQTLESIRNLRRGEQRIPMSYAEYCDRVHDVHAEWVNGEAIIFMSALERHQAILGFLYRLLAQFVELFDLGAVRVAPLEMLIRAGGNAREPDILFVGHERRACLTARRMEGPCDLAVELVSAESVRRDYEEKWHEYAAGGVREYWIIDTREGHERIVCYGLTLDGDYHELTPDAEGRYHSRVVPGFWFRADWLFAEHMPDVLPTLRGMSPEVAQALRDALTQ